MRTNHVVVVPYSPMWKAEFEKIRSEISIALENLALAIEHVGSTSVEGLCAKPIIDIDVVIKAENFPSVCAALENIGYKWEGNLGIEGREAFAYDDKPSLMSHHLYVCPENSAELKRHIMFRDYLRAHPEARDAYGKVKALAARENEWDIDGYIAQKSPIIEEIYKRAGHEIG